MRLLSLSALIPLAGFLAAAGSVPRSHPARAADSTVVVLLGTGFPRPLPDAAGPATAVLVGSRILLFDAGPGVMHQFALAKLSVQGPEAAFITHLHTDHTLGLPDLIFTTWVMRRPTPLTLIGPPGLQRMVDHLAEAYSEDREIRSQGLEGLPRDAWRPRVHEVRSGVVYDSSHVRVTAFRVPHGTWPVALGYRIDTPERSIVVTGDTRPSDEIVKQARGVDVLVIETYPDSIYRRNRGAQLGDTTNDYFRKFHISAVQVGELAKRAQPKLVVLTHIVRMGATDEQLEREVRAGGYAGRVVVGHDLERY